MSLPLPKVVSDVGPGGPLVTSMKGQNALQELMLKNKYYGPNIESEMNNRNALTKGQNITNEYMPDKLRMANALAQLQNQYYGANKESEINGRNALTNKYNTMTPLEAKELQLKNESYREIAESNMNLQKANANFKNSGGGGMGVAQKELKGLESQLSQEHPEWTPEQTNQAASAYINGDSALPDGTQLSEPSGMVQTFVDNVIKRGTTAQGLNQQRFATTTDKLLEEGKGLMDSVSRYAGVLGKGKGGADKIKSTLGIDTPEYNDYMYFTRTFVPAAAGEMMRALGVNASDTQKAIYQQVINPLAWDQNPKGAIENYNRMTKLFKEAVSKTVGKSTGQIRAGLRGNNKTESTNNSGKPDFGKMSNEELKAYING